MKKLLLIPAAILLAQSPVPWAKSGTVSSDVLVTQPTPRPLTSMEKLQLENLRLKAQLLQAEEREVARAICADIPLAECRIDAQAGTVARVAKKEGKKE